MREFPLERYTPIGREREAAEAEHDALSDGRTDRVLLYVSESTLDWAMAEVEREWRGRWCDDGGQEPRHQTVPKRLTWERTDV